MPTIDLPADELAAVTAAIRFAHRGRQVSPTPRALIPLRAALARPRGGPGSSKLAQTLRRFPGPRTRRPPPAAKADKAGAAGITRRAQSALPARTQPAGPPKIARNQLNDKGPGLHSTGPFVFRLRGDTQVRQRHAELEPGLPGLDGSGTVLDPRAAASLCRFMRVTSFLEGTPTRSRITGSLLDGDPEHAGDRRPQLAIAALEKSSAAHCACPRAPGRSR